jgi:hypothetical protein
MRITLVPPAGGAKGRNALLWRPRVLTVARIALGAVTNGPSRAAGTGRTLCHGGHWSAGSLGFLGKEQE